MVAVDLRTEQKRNPIGIGEQEPRLSWKCEGGVTQHAFQVNVFSEEGELWDSGKIETAEMYVICGTKIPDKTRVNWKVRLWDETDQPGEWSKEAYFELAAGDGSLWSAKWITPETEAAQEAEASSETEAAEKYADAMNQRAGAAWEEKKHKKSETYLPHLPASYLRRKFTVSDQEAVAEKSRLYITAHGLYEAYLNGKRVGDYVLMPGCSDYRYELPYQTYDVSGMLREGENELLVLLGDGWYRSTSGVDGDRNLFGDKLALLCQLEIDGTCKVCSDEAWEASQDGALRQNDMQQGEVYDARKEESRMNWHRVELLSGGTAKLVPMDSVPVREQESFTGKLIVTPDGETVIDFGQNLAGYLEFELDGKAGEEILIFCGETLDTDGNFTQENFEDRKRHKENGTYQMISYICKDGKNHYKSRFTIMGFRYAKVETGLDLRGAVFTAHAVYSDMEQTADFSCSNADLNQLFKNSVWSQKGNFCDIPTDCPTRERAGWTGDAGLFVGTGLTLMDSYEVYRKWLAQCRYGQYEDGRVANIAPPNKVPGFMTGLLSGSVAWGDAVILVPYEMYKRTGDIRILKENYEMMKRWYAFLEKRAGKVKLKQLFKRDPYKRYTMDSGLNYGEWCEPGTDSARMMRGGNYDVATAYFAHSGELLGEIAEILGNEKDAEHFKETGEKARKAFYQHFTSQGRIEGKRQCQYVRPIQFGLLSEEECKIAAEQLNELVISQDYHLNTGFLTTPVLCDTLASYGYVETAYRLLLQETAPGWLYEVKNGATTLWETWEGNASLNHYSYGAIAGWLVSGVCGIRYHKDGLEIAPIPHPLLTNAAASYDSPTGKIVSRWSYEGSVWKLHVEIPANVTAEIVLPDGQRYPVTAGCYDYEV